MKPLRVNADFFDSGLGLMAMQKVVNSTEASAQMEDLYINYQRESLNNAETWTLAALVRQYERAMLVRAQVFTHLGDEF